MRNYEERAKDFIKMIFPLIDDCEEVWGFYDAVAMFNRIYTRHVDCRNGIARVAFITSDYVVKLDYDEYEVGGVGGGESEVAMYEIAENEGFGYLFAKVSKFEYQGKRFYIMPRVHGIGRYDRHANRFMTPKEQQFCDLYDIHDLHSNNYGWRNGHICIVDYACNCTV